MAGKLVLIIDDDDVQHTVLGQYLNLAGYQTDHATDGMQAITKIEQKKPDLILLDIQMPIMDGFQTLETIRQNADFRDIPILLLTALDRQYLKVRGLELGADDYITKPFSRAELIARIKAALRRAKRYRSHEGLLEGDLTDMSLSDILQNLEQGAKNACIRLPEIHADIFIEKGMLVHARKGANCRGAEALVRMFLTDKGPFSVHFGRIPAKIPRQPHSLMSVLMNTMAIVDEINAIIERMRMENRLVKIDGDLAAFAPIDTYKNHFPIPLTDLLILMDGKIKDNLNILLEALKKGVLKPL